MMKDPQYHTLVDKHGNVKKSEEHDGVVEPEDELELLKESEVKGPSKT